MRICLATNNVHKIQEVKALTGGEIQFVGLQEIGCTEDLPEEQPTISGNSLQKADYVFKQFNIAAVADDSGLEVVALNNEPGVDSAHYAGPQRSHDDNINLLLKNLEDVTDRRARFITIITLVLPTGSFHQFDGILEGTILLEKKGTSGFGYDPVFLPTGYSRTLAEMSLEEKNSISHRSIAINKLVGFLKRIA